MEQHERDGALPLSNDIDDGAVGGLDGVVLQILQRYVFDELDAIQCDRGPDHHPGRDQEEDEHDKPKEHPARGFCLGRWAEASHVRSVSAVKRQGLAIIKSCPLPGISTHALGDRLRDPVDRGNRHVLQGFRRW